MAKLPFDPTKLPRELARHYVPASDKDIREMFAVVGSKDFPELYSHIDPAVLFQTPPDLPEELSYEALADSME
ncbi:MAG: hypothetical protein ACKOY8_10055, partial [Verrucomicrobiota bacterium]